MRHIHPLLGMVGMILFVLSVGNLVNTCFGNKNDTTAQYKTIRRVVLKKLSLTETDYEYKYDIINGKFVLVPDIQTVYNVMYRDGYVERADISKFNSLDVGDTVYFKVPK